jgi:uncharacterized membrane protein
MNMSHVSVIGWLHMLACVVALAVGGWVLLDVKGTARHRALGRIYVGAAILANLLVFGIYRFDVQFYPPKAGPGIFGLFHYEAAFTLLLILAGWFAATRQRFAFFAYAHPVLMVMSYYSFVAGLVSELFVRIGPLHDFAMSTAHTAVFNVTMTPAARTTQRAVMGFFALVILWHVVRVALRRRGVRRANLAVAS